VGKRVDLSDLERRARASKRKAFGQRVMIPADNALALIARIRELEAGLTAAADSVASSYEDQRCRGEPETCAEAEGYRALVAKGAVLP
jgi:hypothetical protein